MKRFGLMVALVLATSSCNLSGDVMPPPELATAQAAEPLATDIPEATPPPVEQSPAATATALAVAESPSVTKESAGSGTITGMVLNGTSGEAVPAGFEVTLHGFEGQQEVLTQTTLVEESGAFLFEQIQMLPGWVFVISGEHQGLTYGSEAFGVEPGGEPLEIPLVVYDITTDRGLARVERLHLVFEFSPEGVMHVLEIVLVSNLGESTVVAAEGQGILEVALPQGAGALELDGGLMGERFLPTEDGFADTAPIPPGINAGELTFAFQLPYDRRLSFSQSIDLSVGAVVVLMPEDGPDVSGEGLQETGLRQIGDLPWRSYAAGPLGGGEALNLEFSGRLTGVGGTGSSDTSLGIIIGAGALGLALITGALLWYRRTGASGGKEAAEPDEGGVTRNALIQALADLDNAYEAGSVPEDSYRRRREELKRKALALSKERDD